MARKIALILLLFILIGFVLPFGGAYVYGQIRYIGKKTTAERLLTQYEDALTEVISRGKPESSDILTRLGLKPDVVEVEADALKDIFEKIHWVDDVCLFQLPYSSKLGGWCPCGLMYCADTSGVEHWRKYRNLEGAWYFYWEP